MRLIKNFVHLALHVNDIAKSVDFYCNKLGFDEMFSLPQPDGRQWLTYVRITEEQYLELFQVYPDIPALSSAPVKQCYESTFFHFALQVEDLEATCCELVSRGVDVMCDFSRPDDKVSFDPFHCHHGEDTCRIAWALDPDGNRIELMEQPPTCPQQKYEKANPIER